MFGFVPMSDPIMPSSFHTNHTNVSSIVDLHTKVEQFDKPNFLGTRIPVASQLKVQNWELLLKDYWDQQLLQFLQYGFPIFFFYIFRFYYYSRQNITSKSIKDYLYQPPHCFSTN